MGLLASLRPARAKAITADARPLRAAAVDLAHAVRAQKQGSSRELSLGAPWQHRALEMYDKVGLLRAAVDAHANLIGRVPIFPTLSDPTSGIDVPVLEDEAVSLATRKAIMGLWWRLEGSLQATSAGQTGVQGLAAEMAALLTLTGEGFLIGVFVGTEWERYDVVSLAELVKGTTMEKVDGRNVQVPAIMVKGGTLDANQVPPGVDHTDDIPCSYALRVWRPHPRRRRDAAASTRQALDDLELLQLLSAGDRAVARSRISQAGILIVDKERLAPAGVDADGNAIDPANAFLDDFVNAASTAIKDPSDASAVLPHVIATDGNPDGLFATVELSRGFDAASAEKADAALKRIAQALDIPSDLLLGKGELNHWTSWNVDEDAWRSHFAPTLQIIADALGREYLRSSLEGLVDADVLRKVRVGFDPTVVLTKPDRTIVARDAHDRLAISGEAYRRAAGFSEDDAPTVEETALRISIKQAQTSGDAVEVNPLAPDTDSQKPEDKAEELRDMPTVEEAAEAITASAAPALGEVLADLDRRATLKVLAAAEADADRILSKAGARLRSRIQGDQTLAASVAEVPNAALPFALKDRLDQFAVVPADLADDDWARTVATFTTVIAAAQDAALDALDAAAPNGLDPVERAAAQARHAADRDAAASRLQRDLREWSTELLLTEQRTAAAALADDILGELDLDAAVPYGTIRRAVSRAAGHVPSSPRAALGLAGGDPLEDAMRSIGLFVASLRWDASGKDFAPHQALDGIITDDPAVEPRFTNGAGGWPGPRFYPGDHAGCACSLTPIVEARLG